MHYRPQKEERKALGTQDYLKTGIAIFAPRREPRLSFLLPNDVLRSGPLITAACKLEGKINRRNDLERSSLSLSSREKSSEVKRGAGRGSEAVAAHKGDERKSGAIRMMPFALDGDIAGTSTTTTSPPTLFSGAFSLGAFSVFLSFSR